LNPGPSGGVRLFNAHINMPESKPQSAEPVPLPSRVGAVIAVTKRIFTPLAIAFLAFVVWKSWDLIAELVLNADLKRFVLAVMLWSCVHFISPLFAVQVIKGLGGGIAVRRAFHIHAGRLPARYLPGGIWHTVARVSDFRDDGLDHRQLFSFVLVENLSAVSMTFVMGAACLLLSNVPPRFLLLLWIFVAGGLMAMALLPGVIDRFAFAGRRRFERLPYLRALAFIFLFWSLAACSFITYVSAFTGLFAGNPVIKLAGAYLLSWGVGFLAIFAPQGIGIFELVAGRILHSDLSFGGAITMVAGFRIVVLLADLGVWLFQIGVKRIEKRGPGTFSL